MAKGRKTRSKKTPPKSSGGKPASEDKLTRRLSRLYTGALHDVMRGMGLRDFTLPSSIRSVTVQKKIAGELAPLLWENARIDKPMAIPSPLQTTAKDALYRLRAIADARAFREFRRWTDTGPEMGPGAFLAVVVHR